MHYGSDYAKYFMLNTIKTSFNYILFTILVYNLHITPYAHSVSFFVKSWKQIMKSPFTYYGGKQSIVSKIVKYIPPHKVYCEPFCGGATMLFAKPNFYGTNSDHYREVINDTNKLIYNFFVQLRDNGDKLCEMLQNTIYSEELYRDVKLYNGDCDLLKAYYFFLNAMTSYGGKLNSGWAFAKKGDNHPIKLCNKIENLYKFIYRMKSVYVNNTDAIKCITRWDSPDTFFYCDPPYPGTNQGHFSGYTQDDFQNLVDCVSSCKSKVLISCTENDALSHWNREEIIASSGMRNNTARIEYIYANYPLSQPLALSA